MYFWVITQARVQGGGPKGPDPPPPLEIEKHKKNRAYFKLFHLYFVRLHEIKYLSYVDLDYVICIFKWLLRRVSRGPPLENKKPKKKCHQSIF